MKKIIAILMVLAMVFAFVACDKPEEPPVNESTDGNETNEPAGNEENDAPVVMSYAEFVAAELNEAVVVETYIQAKQSWWEKDGLALLHSTHRMKKAHTSSMKCPAPKKTSTISL